MDARRGKQLTIAQADDFEAQPDEILEDIDDILAEI